MGTIELRFFSSLQPIMKARGYGFPAHLEIGSSITPHDLLLKLQLSDTQVEAIMVNGKVHDLCAVIMPGDRVALIAPGTPGPYRVMLGIKKQ